MATKKTSPPEEDKSGKPVKRTVKKPAPKKSTPAAKKAPAKKAPVKKTVKKPETPAAVKNDNPQAEQKKPRPRSPVNGVELPEGRPFKQGEEQRERARRAGKKSGEVRRARKTLREELLELLQVKSKDSEGREHTQQELIMANMIREARMGKNAVKAAEYIRDTIGEKAMERTEVTVSLPKFESLDDAFEKMTGDAQ